MRLKSSDELFSSIMPITEKRIKPYIERYLNERPYPPEVVVEGGPHKRRWESYKDKSFTPSSSPMACQRLLWFERNEKFGPIIDAQKPDCKLQRIFDHGRYIHCMIQGWIEDMCKMSGYPEFLGNEVPLYEPELKVGAYIDSLVRFPGADFSTPIEIKSISSYKFSTLSEPLPNHRFQASYYAAYQNSPFSLLLYYCKDTDEMKEFVVEPIDMGNVIMRWKQVRDALDQETNPFGFSCREGSKEHERCPAREFCFR